MFEGNPLRDPQSLVCEEFGIRDGSVKRIAQMIHDADLGDEKFGRVEGEGLDKVLNGWGKTRLAAAPNSFARASF